MKILIVDDEFVSRKKAQKILSDYGYCDTAMNGNEALEAFRLAHEEGEPYDLITMDIMMPELDGIETLKLIREWEDSHGFPYGSGVKVMMVTSKITAKTLTQSFYQGCEAFVAKPFDKGKLEKAMKEFMCPGPLIRE